IISALGPRSVVDLFTDHLPYQIIDSSQWSEAQASPFNYDAYANPKFNLITKGDHVGFANQAGTAYLALSDYAGYALYTGDISIANVQFTVKKSQANANFAILVQSASDFGSVTTEA